MLLKISSLLYHNCCVFGPAFGRCVHQKTGQNTFLKITKLRYPLRESTSFWVSTSFKEYLKTLFSDFFHISGWKFTEKHLKSTKKVENDQKIFSTNTWKLVKIHNTHLNWFKRGLSCTDNLQLQSSRLYAHFAPLDWIKVG